MTTCANCKSAAVYDYLTIPYCESHLPRFLRDRYGKPTNRVTRVVAPSMHTVVDATLVPEVLEPVVEAVEEEKVEKPASKKKATTEAE